MSQPSDLQQVFPTKKAEPRRTVPGPACLCWSDRLDVWFQSYPNIIAAFIVLAGLVVRIWVATGTYLNPDEAMHFAAANQASLRLAYEANQTISHPPLLIFVLYWWRSLGTSELAIRFPSILAGTAFCWVAYKWLGALFDRTTCWIALILLTFLPSMITLSTEVRQYALLLFWATTAAYFLEQALARGSVWRMVVSTLSLDLAMLSHYSAFLFAAVMGLYAILRMLARRPCAKVIAAWAAGQVGALGVAVSLYVTHLSRLGQTFGRASALQGWMGDAYLRTSYFDPSRMNALGFVLARTGGLFQYVFGQAVIGDLAYLLFLAGVVLLLRRKPAPDQALGDSRLPGIYLLLPFVLNAAAGLAARYPYGGTRHCVFLAPFAIAGASWLAARVAQRRTARAVLFAVLIVAICNAFANRRPNIARADQSSALMKTSIAFIQERTLPTGPLFMDSQTALVLCHYLNLQQPYTEDRSVPGFTTMPCGGYPVIATTGEVFGFTPKSFVNSWERAVLAFGLKPGAAIWVVEMGWNVHLPEQLPKINEFRDLDVHSYGKNIAIFKLTVGQPMPAPALLPN